MINKFLVKQNHLVSVGENLTYKFMFADGVIERELKKLVLSLEISKSFGTSIKISRI